MTPESMAFVRTDGAGGPEVLAIERGPVPRPGRGEVLIRIAAAGLNRADLLQRQGLYPPPPGASPILGLEVSGAVVDLGEGVTEWTPGDDVCALVAGGGYAEFCVAPAPQCLPIPKGMDRVVAAGLPEALFTVWTNVVDRGRLKAGEWFLAHGGAGGIGAAAIQVAHALGATVVATAGSAEKAAFCRGLGADHVIDHRNEDFVERVRALTGKRGVDVILDMVGGDYVQRNLRCLTPEGRLVQIAFLQGSRVALDLMPVLLKRLTVTGSTLRPLPVAEKGAIAAALRREIWPLLESGTMRVPVHAVLPLAQAADAHRLMESGAHMGKILLTP